MDSDDEESESYVIYGSALDPIEEDEIPRKKPLSLEEQVALDKQGRRRFHGAFTGGFSAGFFNTVGTLEGWKPSSFKSSRSERGGGVSQKPEDFMDDEDMEEFGIAPKVIRATSDYRDHGSSRKRERNAPAEGPIPGVPVLLSILQPVRDTVGVRLLKKMGWKPGQGVGPRVTKLEKRQARKKSYKQTKKIYGCSLPEDLGGSTEDVKEDSTEEEGYDEEDILYAPDDIEAFKCKPKNDFFGIGYSGLDRRPILSQDKSETKKNSILNIREKKNKFSISGQAFGVGAFEEEDEDIYSTEDMSHYDFSLEEENQKKSKVKSSRWGQELLPNYAGSVLEGFVLARCRPKFEYFPPPKLPPDFQPFHKVRQTRFETPADDVEVSGRKQGLRRHDITAADREVILSETPRTRQDVPSLLTPSEIKVESVADVESPGGNDPPVPPSAQESVASKGVTQFRPFAANPDKQRRYEQYLGLLKSNQKGRLTELQPLSMTEWERDRERVEFEQAAKLYKPLMGLMFDRFVSAMHPDVGDDGGDAAIRFPKEEESEKKKAAKMKMYGRMTREKVPWTPCSLLFKRFNVPDPGLSAEPEVKRKTSKFSVFDFMASSAHNSAVSSEGSNRDKTLEKSTSDTPEAHQPTITHAEVCEDSSQEDITPSVTNTNHQNEDTSFPTNKIDLFKAIFLSSSESESDEDDHDEGDSMKEVQEPNESASERIEPTTAEETPTPSQLNVERNTSPPRGVFANLDLDSINNRYNSQKDREKAENPPQEESNTAPPKVSDVDLDSGAYGPRLPDKFRAEVASVGKTVTVVQVSSGSSSSEEVEWVEKSSRKSKKSKHHKSHKKKSKKHKSKHKHKKR
ncbi:G patch domain-containing protein 1 homolog [Ischnura elegans]|uniref:G patch domain-containing protein 1 homolog n=1 Tax=Ischnura elegans TaxID=197161 RepID=UPI001ED895F3|nr:G patch domain-containing protein 1 homolog [Ischnura elegans]